MRMYQLHVLALACVVLSVAGQVRAEPARNPVIWADVPDVAAIRVGDTYYMSSTTMHMSPGLPIMKSKDLVNWELIGYAYDTLADNEALRLENGRNAYGAGSWASSFRYHDGTFYVSTFSRTSGRTHIYATTDIEKGDWKETSFAPSLHDHSLFFDDDGRVYMLYGVGDLRLVELRSDLTGIKPDGFNEVVIKSAGSVAGPSIGLQAEGSQMLKVNGKYYVMNITWPRGGMRTQIIHRADKITGPYEGKVVLQDRGVAQGCLIDTPKGDWHALLFQDNGSVGRSPWLVPVKWEGGWPVLGVEGKAPVTLDINDDEKGLGNLIASDEFDRKPGEPLPLAWQWNHNPDGRYWSIGERSGCLRLTAGRVDSGVLQARNMLTQRTFGPVCSATTKIEVGGMKDGDCAGLIALQKKYGFVGVRMDGDSKSIVMVSAQSDRPEEIESLPLGQQTVYLRIDCDFRDRADKADFHFSLDGKAWTKIGTTLKMAYTLPHFMGYRFGLFNFATQSTGGFVDFDYYRVSGELGSAASAAEPAAAPKLPFATPLRWKSTGALVKPVSDANHTIVSVKDPTIVRYNDLWHVYATAYSTSARTWTMVYLNFKDWSDAPSAKLTFIDVNPNFAPRRYNCAPHLFYFTPHKKWYLVFQSQPPQYCTTEDISKPETWTKPQNFFEGRTAGMPRLPIDYHIICDDTHAYLFFTGDDGNFYRSRTRIEDFPRGMSAPEIAIKDRRDNLFEASITYKIKGTNTYLTVIEALSPARYYRAWVSDDLNGQWTPVPGADSWQTPFAGINNVTFEDGAAPWTRDISHGELIRDGYDERMILDPNNLQLLYQGRDPTSGGRYELLPYQLGLLTSVNVGKGAAVEDANDPRGKVQPWEEGARETGKYRNVFLEAGYKQQDIDAKLAKAYHDLFEGPNRVYFEVGDSMAYVSDLKNHDARTEGLSYGMMVAVQLNKKDVFDRLWRWTAKYMQHQEGPREAYFAWSVNPQTGKHNSEGSASDGELYFVTDLLFASNRWGNDTGIDYYAEARRILDAMWSKDGTAGIRNVINVEHKMITFVPEGRGYNWTDPSYHIPAFYEVWAEHAKDGHEDFYRQCAEVSRQFLHRACHPVTGLTPDYAEFSGAPLAGGRMSAFGFDSWRVPMNIALDYSWSAKDKEWQQDYCRRIQGFLFSRGIDAFEDQFNIDGSPRERIMGAGGYRTLRHSLGLVATSAAASLMGTQAKSWKFVDAVWNAKLEPYEDGYFDPYYDGFLYLFSLMHLSGNYRIITPGMNA